MRKLCKTLDKIGRIDDTYVSVFTRFADDLDPIRQEIKKLIALLKTIIHDSPHPSPHLAAPKPPPTLREITNEQRRPPPRSRATSAPCRDQDADELLSQHLTSTALLTPPSEADLAPHWKRVLSERHPIETLYVGRAEVYVFSEALQQAKKCGAVAKATQEVARGLAGRAEEWQVVWEDWWEVWHGWCKERKRSEREEEEEY